MRNMRGWQETVHEKRVLLTRKEELEIRRCLDDLSEAMDCSLTLSHLLRSCLRLICEAAPEIVTRASHVHGLRRPPNGDEKRLRDFERRLGKIIAGGLRDAEHQRTGR